MRPLSGQVAIVTGASAPNGIGRAIAERLAQDGCDVVVSDISGDVDLNGTRRSRQVLLQELAAQISKGQSRAIASSLDVTQEDQVRQCIDQAKDTFGRIDILVNNAGSLAGSDAFMSTTPAEWEMSFRVNLLGPMMMAQAVIPEMQRAGGGRIINIGSTGSLGAEAGFGAYTAMKHGLIGLSNTLAAEFGPDGILCNTVCPGFIETDMHNAANNRLAEESGLSVEEIKARRYKNVALRAAGSPQDVAEAVAFLAGPQGKYITGVSLPVAGGVPPGL